ncbi:hypothetical protein DVS28_a2810 [Euzebya pacifica]|uniref:Uncharacterized protein n=1 Tax=Euzebya pacifica TaxID=1608957 RepID=A0A346XZ42_9ACTN|nr:hypothetical protein [Euzebya pacifica]AXV07489.1 hypothetical protein DVS28_a2810 [Euzebya pacifica]
MQPTDDEQQSGPDEAAGQHLHGFGGSPECSLCPICVALQALGSARPDVTTHLLSAARELALAVKTAAEGQVEATDRAQSVMSDRLTRINID